MLRARLVLLLPVIVPVMLAGCLNDDSTGPTTGALRVTISTSGDDLDPDGYLCTIDGTSSRAVAIDETETFAGLEPGNHVVELSGVSANCSLAGDSQRDVTILAGETTETTFDVTCSTRAQISLLPTDWSMPVGEQVLFHVKVAGPGDPTITWTVNGLPGGSAEVGTIDGDGLYSAPVSIPTENPVTVRAAISSEPASFVESPVTITAGGELSYVLWRLWKPRVITVGSTDSARYEVAFSGYPQLVLEQASGTTVAPIPLRSGVYEFRLSALEVLAGYDDGDLHHFVGYLNEDGGRGNVFINVNDATVPLVSVTELDADIQASSHIVNIRYDDLFLMGTIAPDVLQRFYSFFPDDFDFVAVIRQVEPYRGPSYRAFRNDTDGLGLARFDSGGAYGSARRLQGLIDHPISGFFDAGGPTTIRRMGHRWMVYLKNALLEASVPSWPVSSMARGIMQLQGGLHFPFTVERVSGNIYELVCSGPYVDEFNDLELYLMGLIPPGSVSTHVVFREPLSLECGYQGVTDSITIQDIVAVNGARVPDHQASQKDFRMAAIVLSAGGLLSPDEMAFFNHMAERGEATTELRFTSGFWRGKSKPFYLATGRRATLTTRVLP